MKQIAYGVFANAKIRPAGQKMKMLCIFILFASAAKKVFLQVRRKMESEFEKTKLKSKTTLFNRKV